MNFYDNIVPQINFPDNTFYSNQDKKIDLYPCQYDFYNEHVNKVLLPYDRPNPTNINMLIDDKLLELKKVILNEIIFYKSNNFTFNYNRSFFYNILKELHNLLSKPQALNVDDEIKKLEFIEILKEQVDLFDKKLKNLQQVLPVTIHPLLTNLNIYLNRISIIIQNIPLQQLDLSRLNQQILMVITNIDSLQAPQGVDNLSIEKQDQIKEYFSIVQLLNELFIDPTPPIDTIKKIEQNIKTKFNSLYTDYKLFNKIYRVKDLQIITTNLNEPSKQLERNELIKNAINNKIQLFGFYKQQQYKRVFLPYYIRFENIIEIIKLRITDQMTLEELEIFIYNYNTFFYEIKFGDVTNTYSYLKNGITSNKNYFKIPINYIYDANNRNFFTNYKDTDYNNRITPPISPPQLTNPNQIKYLYIPITQQMNKIYDTSIKKFLFESDIRPKGEYLKYYNKKEFTIKQLFINLQDKLYEFKMVNNSRMNIQIDISIPLYDLIKNEVLKGKTTDPLKLYYTDYNYLYNISTSQQGQVPIPAVQNVNINTLTFYEDIYKDKLPNTFGIIQNEYNLYILIEQFKKQMRLKQPLYLEDFMLCIFDYYNNYIIKNTIDPQSPQNSYINLLEQIKLNIIEPITNLFVNNPNPLTQEIDYYYANEKSKEIIYKESKRGVAMIRLIIIILYIARIYNTTTHNIFQNYTNIKRIFIRVLKSQSNLQDLFTSIINFFNVNIQGGQINMEFINSIIDGSLFSKEKDLFIKKQNVLETSIETATESIQNIASEMDKFLKLQTDSSLTKIDALKDTYDKISTNIMDYFHKEPDYTNIPINITDFEEKNFSLTADVLKNRAKKWITGPIYNIPDLITNPINPNYLNVMNDKIICPDVVQFISEYLNNKSGTDLVSIKNKEQICKNISLLKNTIEKNTSEIKYILPKTFFDDETFMTTFSKKIDEPDTKNKNN
jgi:hypothetical protein